MEFELLGNTIKPLRNTLNGFNTAGKKDSRFKPLVNLRYYLVLYYCIIAPLTKQFSDTGIEHDKRGYSLPRLKKVANQIGLEFDRSRVSRDIYESGVSRGEINIVLANDNYRYYLLTGKGIKYCNDAIKEIHMWGMTELRYMTLDQESILIEKLEKYFISLIRISD